MKTTTSWAAARGLGTLAAALPALAVLGVLGALVGCSVQSSPERITTTPSAVTPSAPPTGTSTVPPTPAVDVPQVDADISATQPAATIPPVRVRVADLGIDMPITSLGLAPDGTMGLDPNPAVAAWYQHGPAPSWGRGATVIAAHVDSLVYDIGPFAKLATAAVGQEVVLTTAEGLGHRYLIDSVQLIDKAAVPWDAIFDRTGTARLTLVTCGGEFDYDTLHYLGSVIVTATPVE